MAKTTLEIALKVPADIKIPRSVIASATKSAQAVIDSQLHLESLSKDLAAKGVHITPEQLAKVEEMRAKLVEAEAKIPEAMAQALREGNLGVMDYYNLRNVAADTEMRDSISKATGGPDDDDQA